MFHLKLCLATATHNIKWVKNTDICAIKFKLYTNIANLLHYIFILQMFFLGINRRLKTAI